MKTKSLHFGKAMSAALFVMLLSVVGMKNAKAQSNHSYVDLGLPSGILWATCNVGADNPEDYGDYFAWGETQPKTTYNWSSFTDNPTTLLPEDDAATANWGSGWRMPTKEEWQELYNNTTCTWTTQNGVSGRLFIAANGNCLFLPAAGYREGSSLYNAGISGLFWSSSLDTSYPDNAWYFNFNSGNYSMYGGRRFCGQSVRPVRSSGQSNAPTGAINGLFSVGENTQVYFSQGNLQYQASTNTWRFAENQWDYVGEGNANISSTYDGWIDLFSWGTSGYNHGANCYQPWSTSTNPSDYYAYGISTYSLNDSTGMADWGYNAISNGDNQENQWYVLSYVEWCYVLFERETSSGIRFTKANVNGCNGVILLPDNWDASNYSLNNTNNGSASYSQNSITSEDWINMLQEAGAVFLPNAGNRRGIHFEQSENGDYWCSTRKLDGDFAYDICIQSDCIGHSINNGIYAQSVRLVRPSNSSVSYIIDVQSSPVEGGMITGAGAYVESQTCTLAATANAGYTFINWTESGEVVFTEPTYSFTVTEGRTLVANFALQGGAPTGAINGLFSVGENTQVYFSQGNLQYQASTNTWRFAENQWDYTGEGNANISPTYDGWIDLFSWGTSGYDHEANCYQPWSISQTNSDYYVYGNYTYNMYDQTGQADWGYNPISNGGNQANQWRTLSQPEWDYVFNTRATTSGIRYAKANVNNVNGVILLPDDWSSSTYSLSNTNNNGASFSSNTLTASQWSSLEQTGAIFLPAAGYRFGTSINNVGSRGDYWSASFSNINGACSVFFLDSHLYANNYDRRCDGQSVRLVCPVQANTSYNIEAVPNPAQGGIISSTGTYNYYNQVTLTANPNEGYTFYQWKENGNVISAENPYTFVALFNRNLEACFLESTTYPLLYSYNDGNHTATVTGHWDGTNAAGDLVIPETVMHNGETYTVTAIGNYAFNGCSGLTGSLVIPNSVTSVGDHAFYSCSNLTSVELSNSVTSIGDNAFCGCSNLTSVELSNSLISIGVDAFWGCVALESIEFPNTIESIGEHAFRLCRSITEIIIPVSVTYIGANPFLECNSLSHISVEEGNTYYDSRGNCNAIIETNTNKLVSGCLTTIIPNTVTSLGKDAFVIVTLTSICTFAETPPAVGINTFIWVNKSIPVYVPCNSSEAYQNAEGWNEFTNFIEMCPGTVTVTANPAGYGTVAGGGMFEGGETCTVTATPNEGCFFSYWTENGQMVSTETTYSFMMTGSRNLTANFYTTQPGMINGLFSVSADQMVCFSQGNLQYQASTNTWRFAENQWDYVGEDNSNISSTYDGWIDLFGWGTGDNPTNHSGGHGDYDPFVDWGVNTISNGGNTQNLWHTLSLDEWSYVCHSRNTQSGIRFVKAIINEIEGIMLFPDNWDAANYSLNNANIGNSSYSSNVISGDDWNYIESFGVVFLPAAGMRYQSNVYIDGGGRYWSCTDMNFDNRGQTLAFSDGDFSIGAGLAFYKSFGHSVRLVRPSNSSLSYTIDVQSSPVEGGTVSGAGTYAAGQNCTLTASANSGYVFGSWTENGETVSTETAYAFTVTGDRILAANFAPEGNYWTPENTGNYSLTMALTGIIQIDGIEQYSDQLEVGAFCGSECRGSQMAIEFFLTNRYLVQLSIAGEIGDELTFKLYDHGLAQELDLTSPNPVTFINDGYGTPLAPYALNFISAFEINATVDPEVAGTITGTGSYNGGATCTLVAEAHPGFQFENWTLDDVVVSTNATYAFTVTQAASYVAHFQYVHTQALPSGWNWYSTYINQSGIDGLTMLENSLGSNGVRIQSKNNGYVDQFEYNGTSYWYGTLNAITNEQMYMVRTNTACNATMTGQIATFTGHPITINNGWNWIGFPGNESVGVTVALNGFTPEANDQIKSKSSGYSTYIVYGNNALWYGTLNTLEPGQGYMYKSNSGESKTLIYQNGRGETHADNITAEGNIFVPEEESFAHNMTITAVVELDGGELYSEGYELAAFVGNECRGCAKLMYVEPLDRYMAFLLVSGENEEGLRFVLTDGTNVSWSEDHLMYNNDEIVGTPTEPAVLHFGPLGVDENGRDYFTVYPNPSKDVFNIEGNAIRKIEIINAYGQVVYNKEPHDDFMQIDLSKYAAGVYMLRVVTDKGITTQQIIKK